MPILDLSNTLEEHVYIRVNDYNETSMASRKRPLELKETPDSKRRKIIKLVRLDCKGKQEIFPSLYDAVLDTFPSQSDASIGKKAILQSIRDKKPINGYNFRFLT